MSASTLNLLLPLVCDDWPLEYCEYHLKYDSPKFKEWAEKNLTEEMLQLHLKGRLL